MPSSGESMQSQERLARVIGERGGSKKSGSEKW